MSLIPKKELVAMKLDDVQTPDESHLVNGFTELGIVDPFSSNPANPSSRMKQIQKHKNRMNPDIEYEHIVNEVTNMSLIKFPSKPLMLKMMRACVNVYYV